MSPSTRAARVFWIAGLALALAACAGTASAPGRPAAQTLSVTVTMQEFAFEPAEISARVGQPVKLTLVNQGALLHDFSSADAEVDVMHMEEGDEHAMEDMDMAMPKLHTAVDVGHTQTIEFTPTQPGTYAFHCTVEGHRDAGMSGRLVVAP